jgi:hypothetical protein
MPNISYSLGWTNIKNLIDEKFYNQFFQNEIIRGIITLLVCFLFNLFLYIGISCFVLVLNCVFLLYTFYVLELCPLHFFNEIWLVIQKKKNQYKPGTCACTISQRLHEQEASCGRQYKVQWQFELPAVQFPTYLEHLLGAKPPPLYPLMLNPFGSFIMTQSLTR